ncbi:MAG: aminopeptidase P family protein [Armatimonadetes bacterium]|nr:aminopeptidase P family protein [Armatimonadota bacterium]
MTATTGPAQRLPALRQCLEKDSLPALLVTNTLNLQYLTGFTGSAGQAVVTPDQAAIFVDSRYFLQAEREASLFEMVKIESPRKHPEVVAEFIQKLGLAEIGFESSLPYESYADLGEKLSGVALKPVKGMIEGMRLVKDADEIARLRGAAAILDACYRHVLPFLRPGMAEREIAVEIECFVRRQGAEREAFESIVASGPLAASPHARATEKLIESGELVKMDFGAMFRGYAGDITRTVAIQRADAKQREVYGVVLEAQEAALAAIRPGAKGSDVDKVARDRIAARGYGDYFGHGLGHSLGRSVHDGQAFSPTSEVVLEPGMVVTVEPGVYIPGWGGVRIEDDIVVTDAGCEVLTHAPKEFTIVGA